MKFKNIFLFGALALFCVACDSDDDERKTTVDDSVAISFVAEANAFGTRMNQDGDQWMSGDEVGFYMVEAGTTTLSNKSSNVIYKAASDGASVKFTSTTPLSYPKDGTEVNFIGYYPFSSAATGYAYPINLAHQTGGSASHDLMLATSEKHSIDGSNEVAMSFKHQLAKLILKFVNAKGEAVVPDKLLIKGMVTSARFYLNTATFSDNQTVADITPYKTSSAYEAIVMPTKITADHIIEYTVGDVTASWNLSEVNLNEIAAGSKYSITIGIPKGDPIEVIVDGSSVTPWVDGGSYDDEAEEVINYTLFPAANATGVHKDTYLKLNFIEGTPTVGTAGKIKVYKVDDNTLVDEINMAEEAAPLVKGGLYTTQMDIVGLPNSHNSNRSRVVRYNPITIEGKTAIIKLHSNKLEYNTAYYVTIDGKVIDNVDFKGFKDSSKLTFTTKAAPAVPTDAAHTVTVGGDESTADFRTVQGAIDFLATNVAKDDQKTVFIQNGTYEELLFLRGVNNVAFKGESKDGVVIRYDNYDGLNAGTGGSFATGALTVGSTVTQSGGRALFLIESANNIRFESLTIENTHIKTGKGDQAEVLYANNDNKSIAFVNCNLLSYQDTLNLKGFCWFYNCLIAGDTDFIWGSPAAALFEKCEIRSVGNGYILQARVAAGNKGFVFLNCDLTTTGAATWMYLARTAANGTYDNITFANCKMADIYATFGWGLAGGADGAKPNPEVATAENGYKTYNCTNATGGVITINNSQYAYALTQAEYEAGFSSRETVLSASSNVSWFTE